MMTSQTVKRREITTVPPLGEDGRSALFLVRVKTPSSYHWDIARYDKGFSKSKPWRTISNNGLEIEYYYELPEAEDGDHSRRNP